VFGWFLGLSAIILIAPGTPRHPASVAAAAAVTVAAAVTAISLTTAASMTATATATANTAFHVWAKAGVLCHTSSNDMPPMVFHTAIGCRAESPHPSIPPIQQQYCQYFCVALTRSP